MPKDAKPAPAPRPPGWYNNQRHPGNHDRNIAFLKEERERIKTDAFEKIEKEARTADEQTGRAVIDNAREKLFPNRFASMSKEERKQERAEDQKIQHTQDYVERSQDYLAALRLDRATERNTIPEPTSLTVSVPVEPTTSLSERFSRSLKYDYMKQGREMVEPIPDRSPDKER